jgi:cytidylate kinase
VARDIEDLVHREVLKWERRKASKAGRRKEQAVQRPVITVSSAHGAEGAAIGRGVAEVFGFDLYDRELVDAIVESADVRAAVVRSLDERARDRINESIVQMFEARHFGSSDYLLHLSRVLVTLGRHGKVVVMGRGAQFLLDPLRTLRVRAVAPFDCRVGHVSRSEGISWEDAATKVRTMDAERRAFCRERFDRDVADPESYDLVLSTASLTVEQCVALVSGAFRLRFDGGARGSAVP